MVADEGARWPPIDAMQPSKRQRWEAAVITNFQMSDALRRKAHRLIPGASHTYAKGDDQYPVLSPAFIARGAGCHVWDVDGNEFIEYGNGNRAAAGRDRPG